MTLRTCTLSVAVALKFKSMPGFALVTGGVCVSTGGMESRGGGAGDVGKIAFSHVCFDHSEFVEVGLTRIYFRVPEGASIRGGQNIVIQALIVAVDAGGTV